jgi:TP901-1 family phage major tail protein
MAAQQGKDLLLKMQDATGVYISVAGLRSRSLTFNTQEIDATHRESAGRWRELLGGSGVRAARLTGTGIFKDAASDALIRSVMFSADIPNWQIVIPDFGMIEGPFQISTLAYAATHQTEVTFELALTSAGPITFTAL